MQKIINYHFNDGQGDDPGVIGLVARNGQLHGPWQALSNNPDNRDPRTYWTVEPNVVLPAGMYTVTDSSTATWAHNAKSGHRGMCWVIGTER